MSCASCRQRRQIQTAQRTEAIVDRYVDTAAASQARPVVDRGGRAPQDVSAAVHEDHDGQRLGFRRFRCDDIKCETVLPHRLVFTDADHRVATLLRCALGEAVAIPHTSPRLGGLRRPKPQRTNRRPGVRDGPPTVHAVTGEAFDGAGGSSHADGVFVHSPDGSEPQGVTLGRSSSRTWIFPLA